MSAQPCEPPGRKPVPVAVAARQIRLLEAAVAASVSTDATRAFLNQSHAALGGRRPIDVALESDAGLLTVERLIRGGWSG